MSESEFQTEMVSDLLEEQHLTVDWLVYSAGLERRLAEAIARQKYPATREQRERVARALGICLGTAGEVLMEHDQPAGAQAGQRPSRSADFAFIDELPQTTPGPELQVGGSPTAEITSQGENSKFN